jgi:hypothetical protein
VGNKKAGKARLFSDIEQNTLGVFQIFLDLDQAGASASRA